MFCKPNQNDSKKVDQTQLKKNHDSWAHETYCNPILYNIFSKETSRTVAYTAKTEVRHFSSLKSECYRCCWGCEPHSCVEPPLTPLAACWNRFSVPISSHGVHAALPVAAKRGQPAGYTCFVVEPIIYKTLNPKP